MNYHHTDQAYGPTGLPLVLKPKACISCRTRKVKCDRKIPCTNCTQWSRECLYPSPIRRCQRARKKTTPVPSSECGSATPDVSHSVDARLEKLEKAVSDLTSLVQTRITNTDNIESGEFDNRNEGFPALEWPLDAAQENHVTQLRTRNGKNPLEPLYSFDLNTPFTFHDGGFGPKLGAFNGSFQLPRQFPSDQFTVELSELHLPPTQAQECWKTFLDNVDPLVKVLHRQTIQRVFLRALYNKTAPVSKGQEALLLAVYFSSISSMPAEDVELYFGVSKSTAVATYCSITEKALMRAGCLTAIDAFTLQAYVLFLSFNRFTDDTQRVWALTSLARRLNLSAPIEQSPFERETRNRLWWQLWYLDQRVAEDYGDNNYPAPIPELPLNVNDLDLDPSMTVTPIPHADWTEVSFCLIRLELAKTSREIENNPSFSWAQKERMIDECEYNINYKYLKYCSISEPIQWLSIHVAHTIITEMRLQLHSQKFSQIPLRSHHDTTPVHHEQHQGQQQRQKQPASSPPPPPSQSSRDQLFIASIDIVDTSRRIKTEPQSGRWKWLLNAYLQFLPLTFLLKELCSRPITNNCKIIERALKVAVTAFARNAEDIKISKNGMLIDRLMTRVKFRRDRVQMHAEWQPSFGMSMLQPQPQPQPTSASASASAAPHFPPSSPNVLLHPDSTSGLYAEDNGMDAQNTTEDPLYLATNDLEDEGNGSATAQSSFVGDMVTMTTSTTSTTLGSINYYFTSDFVPINDDALQWDGGDVYT